MSVDLHLHHREQVYSLRKLAVPFRLLCIPLFSDNRRSFRTTTPSAEETQILLSQYRELDEWRKEWRKDVNELVEKSCQDAEKWRKDRKELVEKWRKDRNELVEKWRQDAEKWRHELHHEIAKGEC